MPSYKTILIVFLAVPLLLGRGLEVLAQGRSSPPRPEKRGVVFVVGGVGGWDVLGCSAQVAFRKAGLPLEVRDFVWTHGFGQVLKDLQDTRHLLKKAKELAAEIQRLRFDDPHRPIFLVAKSGGTGLALLAAELLPPGTLTRMILLSAAVSPDYDLRSALRATHKEIVSFYSPYDVFILDWGTRQFGTIDRVYGPSAGVRGFQVPAQLSDTDRALHDRLVQIRWSPYMIWEGYAGGHGGTSLPSFLKVEVTPWLK